MHLFHAWRASGASTTPVLVTREESISDSTAILQWADRWGARLYPDGPEGDEVRALEEELDEGLGRDGRRWMYSRMLEHKEEVRRWGTIGLSGWERRAFPALIGLARPLISWRVDLSPDAVGAAKDDVLRAFDEIAARLGDGRRYLVGDAFSAADLTFAALAASVLWPPQYGSPLPQPEDVPEDLAADVERFRGHPAGRFALRLYAAER